MKALLKITCLLSLAPLTMYGQQGDTKDPKGHVQKDPIPADQIPPSPFLNKEQALKSLVVSDGFVMENIAEDVHQPVSLSFDADGRAWVVEMTNYMIDVASTDERKPAGRIKVLEDTNGDGQLDKSTVFLDKLIIPRACAVTSDGLLYTDDDQLLFIKRGGENGLTPEGKPEIIDKDYARGGNVEHKPNGLLLARDNWYYNAKSDSRYRRVDGKWLKQKTAFRGQWGIAQDDAGRLYHNTNSVTLAGDSTRPNLFRHHPGYTPKHKVSSRIGTNRIYTIRMNPGVNRAYRGILDKSGKLTNCTAAAGMTIYRGENFPKELYGTAFISIPCGNLIKAMKVEHDSSNKPIGSFLFKEKEFVASTDEWFRPVNIYTAPDGTLWVIDAYIGLLQHTTYMTTYLKKQYVSRGLDKPKPNNGRLYRVRYEVNKVSEVPKMSTSTIAQLQVNLSHVNGTVRDTAQRLIVERITSANGTEDYKEWNKLNTKPSYTGHGLLHAIWAYESMNWIPNHLIEQALDSDNSDIVNSALELAHYSSHSEVERLISYKPNSKTVLSYVFALGKIATTESYARAVAVIKENKKQTKELEAVYVSGLGNKVADLIALKLPMENSLAKILGDATKSGKGKVVKGPEVPAGQKARYKHGKSLYLGIAACSGCHGLEGQGQADMFPPLAGSEWVNGNPDIMAKVILHGLEGPITVAGEKYKGEQAMPAYKERVDLTDEDLASLMTYIRYMKGNKGGAVTADQVKKVKDETKNRSNSYTEKELRKEIK